MTNGIDEATQNVTTKHVSINTPPKDELDGLIPKPWENPIDRDLSASKVNHPAHYNGHPRGYECIDIIEDAPFNIGNAIKLLWRVTWGNKGNKVEDCEKAIWYIQRHIDNLKKGTVK